jgi:hypothetical protein
MLPEVKQIITYKNIHQFYCYYMFYVSIYIENEHMIHLYKFQNY